MKTLPIAAAIAALCIATAAQAADSAQYQVRVDATWTAETHPLDYPGNAHFSGLVGATSNGDYLVFADGAQPTPGLEALSEKGAHSPLDAEIKAAIAKGDAGAYFESGALFSFPGVLASSFEIDAAHPYVSLGMMVAPSPDWFTGVSKVSLLHDGEWVDEARYTLFVWDAGTDSATLHKAEDDDTMPRQSTRLNAAPQFKDEAGLKPVGTITFTRMDNAAAN